MRLPPHVVRRRQCLYLRLRLPPDLARASGRSHVFRTLKTSDPAQARARAATESAAIHDAWERTRLKTAGTYMGRQTDQLSVDDLVALKSNVAMTGAAIKALSPEDNVALGKRVRFLIAGAERELHIESRHKDVVSLMREVHDGTTSDGLIEGLKQAIALGGRPA